MVCMGVKTIVYEIYDRYICLGAEWLWGLDFTTSKCKWTSYVYLIWISDSHTALCVLLSIHDHRACEMESLNYCLSHQDWLRKLIDFSSAFHIALTNVIFWIDATLKQLIQATITVQSCIKVSKQKSWVSLMIFIVYVCV